MIIRLDSSDMGFVLFVGLLYVATAIFALQADEALTQKLRAQHSRCSICVSFCSLLKGVIATHPCECCVAICEISQYTVTCIRRIVW